MITIAKNYYRYSFLRLQKILLRHSRLVVAKTNVSFLGAKNSSDISEHLNFLYFYLHCTKPKNILELGTRGGESTRVLEKYCSEMDILGRSIDLGSAPGWLTNSTFWKHYIGDDIAIGKNLLKTKQWPDGDLFTDLDFIFVDTSHIYEHTLTEIEIYSSLLSKGVGSIVFHDTNLTSKPTRLLSGEIQFGWDNQRGVARAIEQHFGFNFSEDTLQSKLLPGGKWFFYHLPWNNGFSVLLPAVRK
jgi:cephalosporin hydroxylase